MSFLNLIKIDDTVQYVLVLKKIVVFLFRMKRQLTSIMQVLLNKKVAPLFLTSSLPLDPESFSGIRRTQSARV